MSRIIIGKRKKNNTIRILKLFNNKLNITLISLFLIVVCNNSEKGESSDYSANTDPESSIEVPVTEVNPSEIVEEPGQNATWKKLTLSDPEDTSYEKSEDDDGNTGGSATGYYKNIVFKKAPAEDYLIQKS